MSRFRIPRRRPSAALVVACCSLFVALGGTSYALAVGSIGSLEVRDDSLRSIDVHNRSLRGHDLAPDSVGGGAIKEETLDASKLGAVAQAAAADHAASADLAANARQADHAASADLAASARHADSATHADSADSVSSADSATTAAALQLQVVVAADGGRYNARGVSDVDKVGTGIYIVTFDRDVQDCVGAATPIYDFDIAAPPSAAGTAQIAVQFPTGLPTPLQARQVWVHTGSSAGTQDDRGFHLLVSC